MTMIAHPRLVVMFYLTTIAACNVVRCADLQFTVAGAVMRRLHLNHHWSRCKQSCSRLSSANIPFTNLCRRRLDPFLMQTDLRRCWTIRYSSIEKVAVVFCSDSQKNDRSFKTCGTSCRALEDSRDGRCGILDEQLLDRSH